MDLGDSDVLSLMHEVPSKQDACYVAQRLSDAYVYNNHRTYSRLTSPTLTSSFDSYLLTNSDFQFRHHISSL